MQWHGHRRDFIDEQRASVGKLKAADSAEVIDERAGTEAAGRLTRQLQAISGRQSMRREPTDLNEVVQDASDVLFQIAGPDIDVRLDLGSGLPLVALDGSLLAQVLRTLVAASRDALPRGGRIVVRTAIAHDLLGPRVTLSVEDTREASALRALGDRVFEPRLPAGPHLRGAGLVLAAVRGIVRQCNGHVSVQDAEPEGDPPKALPRPVLPSSCSFLPWLFPIRLPATFHSLSD